MANKISANNCGLLTGPIKTVIRTTNVRDDYEIGTEIARGKFAVVWHAKHRQSGKEFAAKVVKKRRRGKTVKPEVVHEIAVLEACSHSPYIVDIYEVFEDDHEMVLILELASGGELQQLCDDDSQDLKEEHVRRIVEQTLAGVHELHKLNIVHLDIKPSNILLGGSSNHHRGDFTVKLCDFGISRMVSGKEEVREILGTPDYVAPEVLNFDPISTATDMWSIGVLTYVMLTGISPFAGETNQETFVNINQGRVEFPEDMFGHVSSEGIDFMKKLLVKNPRNRMTIDACRKHPWISTPISENSPCESGDAKPTPPEIPAVVSAIIESQHHSEILIQIVPTISTTSSSTSKDQVDPNSSSDVINSPPMRRPVTAEKENLVDYKRFKFPVGVVEISAGGVGGGGGVRKASLGSAAIKSQVVCK